MLKLTLDKQVKAINYSIDTFNGQVFIMGIAQDTGEKDRVTSHAQNTGSVRRVTNYAVLKNDHSRSLKVIVSPPPPTLK